MSLASSFTTTADTDRLREFVKLPENKLWLGRASRFYNRLDKGPTITSFPALQTASQELLEIAEAALKLIDAAKAGCDAGDEEMLNRFSGAVSEKYQSKLSPTMAAAAKGKA